MQNHPPTTHEIYLHAVRDVVIARARQRDTITIEHGERLAHTKLLYGGRRLYGSPSPSGDARP
jgi:hypothetical protein